MNSPMYYDVWAGDDIQGTALGELSHAYGKEFRDPDQAVGFGSFKINRHDAQAAWAVNRNFVRVRFDAGGPFAWNDGRYVFGFWIEESQDVALSPEEEGGEELTRGGRSSVAILERARLYPTNHDSRDAQYVAKVPKTGQWTFVAREAGEVMRLVIRNAIARTPNPLAGFNHDFGVTLDSVGTPWTAPSDWQLKVGTDYLSILSTMSAGGVFFRCGADVMLHCYEDHPGVDLSASILFSKGVELEDSAEKQIHAVGVSRAIVEGTKENNEFKYREVVDAGLEASIGRIEGFAEYKATPTNARLDKAGTTAIAKSTNQDQGPTTVGARNDVSGKQAYADYLPGDTVTVDIPGVFDTVPVRIAAFVFTEAENGEADLKLELKASPFDPAGGDGLFDDGTGAGGNNGGGSGSGGGIKCGDCPEPEPYIPGPASFLCEGGAYPVTPSRSFPIHGGPSGAGPADGLTKYAIGSPVFAPAAPGAASLWGFPEYNTGGVDYAGDCTNSLLDFFIVGPGRLTMQTYIYAGNSPRGMRWTVYHDGVSGAVVCQGPTDFATGALITIDVPSHEAPNCAHIIRFGDADGPCGSKWGWGGATWEASEVVAPEAGPDQGQWTTEEVTLEAAQTAVQTNYPYSEGSPVVQVQGALAEVANTTPTTGTFTLPEPYPAGTVLTVRYQIKSTTATGATNPQPTSAATDIPFQVLPTGTGATQVAVGNHTHASMAAADVSYNNTTSGLVADDVQAAIDELAVAVSSPDPDTIRDAGRWEIVMTSGVTSPPVPVEETGGADWVYGWVPG